MSELQVEKFNKMIEDKEKEEVKRRNKPTLSDMMNRPPDTRHIKDYGKVQGGLTE